MSLEILEEGHLPNYYYYGTCNRCNCKVRCTKGDGFSDLNLRYTEASISRYFDLEEDGFKVQCPTEGCYEHIVLSNSENT